MSTPRNWWNLDEISEDKRWSRLTLFLKDIYTILNKGIIFEDNLRGTIVDVTFSAANSDTAIVHGLAFTPTKYIVLSRSGNFVVYDGAQSATKERFYLRSSATGSISVLLF